MKFYQYSFFNAIPTPKNNCRNFELFITKPNRFIFQQGAKSGEKPPEAKAATPSKSATEIATEMAAKLPPAERAKWEAEQKAKADAEKAEKGAVKTDANAKIRALLGLPPVGGAPSIAPQAVPKITPDASKTAEKPSEKKENPLSTLTGHEFMGRLKDMKPRDREEAIIQAVTKENIPAFQDVKFKFKDAEGKEHTAQFSITRDVINVGIPGNKDAPQIRAPMAPNTAQAIAKNMGLMLPTAEMVDHLLQDPAFNKVVMPTSGQIGIPDVEVKKPDGTTVRVPDGKGMKDPEKWEAHSLLLDEITQRSEKPGQIGGKKIIVIGSKLNDGTPKLNFHGGLRPDGQWYQNNDLAHEWGKGGTLGYLDYSHGVLFAKPEWQIDGVAMPVSEVIKKYPGLVGAAGLSEDIYSYYQDGKVARSSEGKNAPVTIVPENKKPEEVASQPPSSPARPIDSKPPAEIASSPRGQASPPQERTINGGATAGYQGVIDTNPPRTPDPNQNPAPAIQDNPQQDQPREAVVAVENPQIPTQPFFILGDSFAKGAMSFMKGPLKTFDSFQKSEKSGSPNSMIGQPTSWVEKRFHEEVVPACKNKQPPAVIGFLGCINDVFVDLNNENDVEKAFHKVAQSIDNMCQEADKPENNITMVFAKMPSLNEYIAERYGAGTAKAKLHEDLWRKINNHIGTDTGKPGHPKKVVPLDELMADAQDPSKNRFAVKGDVHTNVQGKEFMAKQLQNAIAEVQLEQKPTG